MTEDEYVRLSYSEDVPYEYDLEEARREQAYNEGDTNPVLYRLFKYLPSDPDTLYSPVGQTGIGTERMGTTVFRRGEITKDIRDQGFFAEASPLLAAQWFKYKREADFTQPEGNIRAEHKDPFNYAIFPISYGVAKNWKWFQEHPEVAEQAQFGIADGLIVDEIKIIGDPVYEWKTEYSEEAQRQDKTEQKYWRSLMSCMTVVKNPHILEIWKSKGVTDAQIDEMKEQARKVSKDAWNRQYQKDLHDWRSRDKILPPDDPRILAFLS